MVKSGKMIGIDLGITDFAILSDGRKLDNHQFTSKMEKKLKREQRKLSRRVLRATENGFVRLAMRCTTEILMPVKIY